GEILFIDARKMGTMVDRKHRELDYETEIKYIADTYHKWKKTIPQPVAIDNELGMVAESRGVYQIGKHEEKERYRDIKGFCKSATLDEVRSHEYILTPGRYVGIEKQADDGEPFDEKMNRLTGELAEMFAKRKSLEEEIRKRLGAIGYEF
ncbi:MAG: N-6 DNA methylase, partial [Firmicutes bacterium HGW-Firmicutes-13]